MLVTMIHSKKQTQNNPKNAIFEEHKTVLIFGFDSTSDACVINTALNIAHS